MAKTTIATGLAALLALSALGAFASPQDETAGAPMEITWSGLDGAEIFDDNLIEQHIEEKLNVEIINVTYDLYARDAIELTIAADDHADAFYGWIDSIEWFFKGAFRTIPREMIEEHAPRYAAFMDSLGPGAWVYSLAPGSTTAYMGLPRAEQGSQGCDRAPTWRLDWLEQLGMDPRDGMDAETGAPAETLDVSGPTYEDGPADLVARSLHVRRLRDRPARLPRRRLRRQRPRRHRAVGDDRRPRLLPGQVHRLLARPGADVLHPRRQRRSQLRRQRSGGPGRHLFTQQDGDSGAAELLSGEADRSRSAVPRWAASSGGSRSKAARSGCSSAATAQAAA